MFEELIPSVLPLFKKKKKKHIRLGHAGVVDHSVDLSIPGFTGGDHANKIVITVTNIPVDSS